MIGDYMINYEKMSELDSHWKEIIDLAVKYGFITQAYGGAAVLITHKNQLKAVGEEQYLFRQKEMFNNNMGA